MIHHLRAAGTSFVLDARGAGVPSILHWGRDLGELSTAHLVALATATETAGGPSAVDHPLRISIVPTLAEGWSGQPGIAGFHLGGTGVRRPNLRLDAVEAINDSALRVHLVDDADGHPVLALTIDLELAPQGVLRQRIALRNLAEADFVVGSLSATLPVPDTARERLDFTGTWSAERAAQRAPIDHGTWLRESRHGRPGHDDSFLLAVGEPGFGYRDGEVWAFHLASSGDKRTWLDSTARGRLLVGLGESLEAGEIVLGTGASHTTPWAMAVWSDAGIDGVSRAFHRWFRALPAHPDAPRPLTLNTWEAVYFDHNLDRLLELAELGASIGVERFVLDDGWMTGRTDDARALGDWTVDASNWPSGLTPLVDRVLELGMQFGLWVEPEMVSLDSELARSHPEWILRESSGTLPLPWRHQYVLDLANPEAWEHTRAQLTALLDEYPISALKWDMNRDLLGGSTHRQVEATYRLMQHLVDRYPGLEIESCASGGGRVDAGVLAIARRVWPSDTNDALERQAIQRHSNLLVPLEYLGAHIGANTSHTTGRTHSLSFRLAVALFAHAGIEWDLTRATEAELAALRTWSAGYREWRGLIHTGDVVRADSVDGSRWLSGVVSADGAVALFLVATTTTAPVAAPGPLRIPGLDAAATYVVRPLDLGAGTSNDRGRPAWWEAGEITLTGAQLAAVGLTLPLSLPEQAVVLRIEARD